MSGVLDSAIRVWIGIWGVSDRNGIFPWRPRKWVIRFAPGTHEDPDQIFQQLIGGGLVEKFEANAELFGFSVKWGKHQDPHIDEAPVYPMPTSPNFIPCPPRHWTKRNAKWMMEVYGLAPSAQERGDTGAETTPGRAASPGAPPPVGPPGPSFPSCPSGPSGLENSCPEMGEPPHGNTAEKPVLYLPCVGVGPKEFPPTGFGLSGGNGVGKTFAIAVLTIAMAEQAVATAMARMIARPEEDFLLEDSVRRGKLGLIPLVTWISWPSMIAGQRARLYNREAQGEVESWVQDKLLSRSHTLILDDIGAEHVTAQDWAGEILGRVIDERQRWGGRTIWTSNLDRLGVAERYGARIYSRLHAFATAIELPRLPDLRVRPCK